MGQQGLGYQLSRGTCDKMYALNQFIPMKFFKLLPACLLVELLHNRITFIIWPDIRYGYLSYSAWPNRLTFISERPTNFKQPQVVT